MLSSRRDHPSRPAASRPHRDRVVRSAVLGLLVYALGLIPFFLLTPVHQAMRMVPLPPIARPSRPVPTPDRPRKAISEPRLTGIPTSQPFSTRVPLATRLPLPTRSPHDSRFAILLLGYGGGNHPGGYLTDSLLVVIADPTHRTLTLLSLPRDAWVPLSFDGKTTIDNKINTAYAFARDPSLFPDRLPRYTGAHGAGHFASDTVSRLIGVPIRYDASLDFVGFRAMINAVGGIDVNVPDSFAARYPINDNPSINADWTVVRFQKGQQHMNGERAIEYARAREAIQNLREGSDFARARRQRLILEAFKTRLLQPSGLIHLPRLLAIAARHIDTNYSVPALTRFTDLILHWKDVTVYQTALTNGNYLEEGTGPAGTYLLVPSSRDHSWAQIRAFTRRLWQDPSLGVAMARTTLVVENDTGVPGTARRLSAELQDLGYNVGQPMTGPLQVRSRLVDPTGQVDRAFLQQVTHDLGITLPVIAGNTGTADRVVVELGSADAGLRLSVSPDPTAPSSTRGVVKFGVWPYTPATLRVAATTVVRLPLRPAIPDRNVPNQTRTTGSSVSPNVRAAPISQQQTGQH